MAGDWRGIRDRPPEINHRSGVHFGLLPDTRNEFRLACIRKGLSMQEVLEEIAERVVIDDPYMVKLMDDLVKQKREHIYKQLSPTDASSLYDMLEMDSIFSKRK